MVLAFNVSLKVPVRQGGYGMEVVYSHATFTSRRTLNLHTLSTKTIVIHQGSMSAPIGKRDDTAVCH